MARTLDLPLSNQIKGHTWRLYYFNYETLDTDSGQLSGYIYATSDDHAKLLISELKESAVFAGQVMGQYDE